ncbi:MAG TPA: hypothetical protein VMI54_06675 [Polyangiaceae bacterium]|nr:hypothetical protein [Polyangiaceae bacterium]
MWVLVGASVGLFALAALTFWIVFKHVGAQARRLDREEAGEFALYGASTGAPNPDELASFQKTVIGPAAGTEVELHFGIDDLREAHRAGDWKIFWLWPVAMSSFVGAIAGLLEAAMLLAGAPWGIQLAVGAFVFLFVAVIWFMPWAAVHTKIDLGTAEPKRRPQVKP